MFLEFQDWFSTDEKCLDYLSRLHWPDGFLCPKCAGIDAWHTSDSLWMCTSCSRRTSVTAGTIFDPARNPMRVWFAATCFVTSQKNGVSALGLQRVLGLKSYETAWVWMHKLRRGMVVPERDLFSGTVEVDETFVGGISRGKPGRASDKGPVIVAAENLGKNPIWLIRLKPTPKEGLALVTFAQRVVDPGSLIKINGAQELRRLPGLGFEHQYVTQLGSTVPAHIDLPAVHRVASLLKRWMIANLHYGASREQFNFYLDEFTFRFNRRTTKSRGVLFYRLLQQCITTATTRSRISSSLNTTSPKQMPSSRDEPAHHTSTVDRYKKIETC